MSSLRDFPGELALSALEAAFVGPSCHGKGGARLAELVTYDDDPVARSAAPSWPAGRPGHDAAEFPAWSRIPRFRSPSLPRSFPTRAMSANSRPPAGL
jgi:hypothetical protein